MKAHCFFEQSGTFKNEFKKLGYKAYDYDIQNEFGQTDFVIDLFGEISKAYEGGGSIFDKIEKDDLILAFFPCVRFEDQIMLHFRCQCNTQKKWSDIQKLEYAMKMQNELSELYCLISKLCVVCLKKKLRIVIENPYSEQHFLKQYWCLKPKIIDKDRTENGDFMKKPTQYFFINFEPKNNLVFEPLEYVEKMKFKRIKSKDNICRKTLRSMIHPQYASRFIRQYLI